ncbi:hypothetical protein [Streptococcus sp. CSL10205-OR2]|uniref:hypothetical protein n=1 Tax=Streptococcus sp. CSL10205-OR2 TaxID=2980558 RepID=UPI0021D86169|nr:hypothetical protein [Streptococcus sp. CSL10205-OR2]MCU9533363.1 hypothetical protein [Streptococcus sp. CSL10205-OR2]
MSVLENVKNATGFQLDKETGTLYGVKDGFHFAVIPTGDNKIYQLLFSLAKNNQPVVDDDYRELKASSKVIKRFTPMNYKIIFDIKTGLTKTKTAENIQQALEETVSFFKSKQYDDVDEMTGISDHSDIYLVSGVVNFLSPESYAKMTAELNIDIQKEAQKSENVIAGIIGALLGSLIGVAAIVIIGQLGYVSIISGVIMGVSTISGYELLGKRLTKKGIAISVIIMLVMVYVANQADIALSIARYYEVSFFEIFPEVNDLVAEGYIDSSIYWTNLGMIYLFSVLGFGSTVFGILRSRQEKFTTRRLG